MEKIVARFTLEITVVFYLLTLMALMYMGWLHACYSDFDSGVGFFTALGIHVAAWGLLSHATGKHRLQEMQKKRRHVRVIKSERYPGVRYYIGTPEQFLKDGVGAFKEVVEKPAMKSYNGRIYAADPSFDHTKLRAWLNRYSNNYPVQSYGWITNKGRYIDLDDAWAMNQVGAEQNSFQFQLGAA